MVHHVETVSLPKVKYPRILIAIGLFFGLLLLSILNEQFGVLGIDSDDKLRFMQIRDYLQGQSWFDVDQYRLGLGVAGTDMHWSRLPDIPIILLTHFFDIFVSQEKALNLAISIWPPLSGLILFAAFIVGAKHVNYAGNRKYLRNLIYLLAIIFILGNLRFRSGSIDHHNIQFGFVIMAMALLMEARMRFMPYFLSGLATALSIAVGPEVYVFAAVICGFVALNWAVNGQISSLGTQGFGIGLGAGVIALFLATIPATDYAIIYCDSLSSITVLAASLGGFGLAFAAKLCRHLGKDTDFKFQAVALFILGGICLIALSFQAPQCLSNPLSTLPDDVLELWLGSISEAQPLTKLDNDWPMLLPMVLGPLALTLIVLMQNYYIKYKASSHISDLWDADVLNAVLFISAFMLTIYQIRFFPFAYLFAILPLSKWIAKSYEAGLVKSDSNVNYILCLALSIPMIWTLPGSRFVNLSSESLVSDAADYTATNCTSDDVIDALNSLPVGLIITDSNYAGQLLIETPHHVVSGNYHRNWQGISTEIQVSISSPNVSYQLLVDNAVNYFYFCKAVGAKEFADYNPEGLLGQMYKGNIPSFLELAIDKPLEDGQSLIFKVVRKP